MKRKNKNILILITIVVFALIIVGGYNSTRAIEISTTISLQFDGVEKGLNPDDTRFDYKEIISEEAIKFVAQKAEVEYREELLELVSITPVLPGSIVETIKGRRIKGEEYTYFPNEFIISINSNEELGYDQEKSLRLLKSYKDGYEEYFIDKYTYPFIGLGKMLSYFDYSKYDYPELTKVFDSEFNMISSYLNVLISDNPEFVSSKGYTFNDIKETINLSKNLDLNQIDALVSAYELTNDLDKLILKYEYMIKKYQLDKNKKENQYAVSDSIIAILESNESSVVLPGIAGDFITVSALDDTYDTIASDATNYRLSAGNSEEEIKYLNAEIEKLYNSRPETADVIAAKAEVDQLVLKLNEKILNWINMIEESAEEYFDEKYEGAVSLVKSVE